MHHLFDYDTFAQKFRKIVEGRFKRYGYFEYDTEGEIARYKVRPTFTTIARADLASGPRGAIEAIRRGQRRLHS